MCEKRLKIWSLAILPSGPAHPRTQRFFGPDFWHFFIKLPQRSKDFCLNSSVIIICSWLRMTLKHFPGPLGFPTFQRTILHSFLQTTSLQNNRCEKQCYPNIRGWHNKVFVWLKRFDDIVLFDVHGVVYIPYLFDVDC